MAVITDFIVMLQNKMTSNFIQKDADTPAFLRKYLEKDDHVDNFLKGNIIIRRIEVFVAIEDGRRDETENTAHSVYKMNNGTIDSQLTSVYPVYILSLSGPYCDIDKCRNTFGHHSLVIDDPIEFKSRIREAWNLIDYSSGTRFHKVVYNKGEETEAPAYLLPPHGISLWQKKRSFEHENEYRFICECRMSSQYNFANQIDLKIGDIKDIARKDS